MVPTSRALALILCVFLAAPAVLAQEPSEAGAAVCPAGLRQMDGVGLVCPRPDGLYEVFDAQLRSLGLIHGTDPVPAGAPSVPDPEILESGTNVNCVSGATGTYFIQVIYARATNDADGYASWLPTIRTMVGNANKLVDDAALATGGTASLNVKCVSGVVEVKNEVLPTALASSSFSSIVTDLRNKGYNDAKVKYWVFFDATSACTCGGTGHLYNDDTLAATNLNNGNGVSMFAVDFGYNSVRVWLHELGHNMGAVQNGAPYTTGAGHCYDGLDIMCYNDGGPNGGLYSTSYCAAEVWDCNKNTYFHATAPAGSWLATHWNLGNSLNRFITFGIPQLQSLSCSPSTVETGVTVTCSFLATDDSSGVRYTVTWDDGATTYYPSSTTFTAPGVSRSASHAYAAAGTMTVTVSVVDNAGFAGNSRTATISVSADLTPPTMSVSDPATGFVYNGCTVRQSTGANLAATWIDAGCVRVTASDARSGMSRVEVYVNGALRASDSTAPYEIVVPVTATQAGASVRIEAVDNAGNRASSTWGVNMVAV